MPTPEEFRQRFPALTDTAHFASCSQGAMSDALVSALLELQYTMREQGAPWHRWMEEVDTARDMFADLIGAHPDEVAVVSCASAAAFQVASTQDWAHRPRIVTTDMEFPSIAHVWLAQQPFGAQIVHASEHDGILETSDYESLIDETCSLVSVPLVSYRNGLRLPMKGVIQAAKSAGARTFVDAYQGTGVEPIDVHELDCDYLTSGSLKYLLGLPGIAFLYVRSGMKDAAPPVQTGWFGQTDPYSFDPLRLDQPPHARRFESGTPSIPSAFGAVAGMRMIQMLEPAAVMEHIAALTQELHERLLAEGCALWSPDDPALRGPQVALVDDDPDDLAAFLAERRIVTSPRGRLLRLSLHYYNTSADIDSLVEGMRAYRSA
jgi:selenocysteine lyase/cysteine desulfurase